MFTAHRSLLPALLLAAFLLVVGAGQRSGTPAAFAQVPPLSPGPACPPPSSVEVVSGGPYTGWAGTPMRFSGYAYVLSTNSAPQGSSYQWDFGDQTGGSGQITTHVYDQPGSYVVRFIVSAGSDTNFPPPQQCLYSDTTTVTIQPPLIPLQASAGGPYSGTAGNPVAFTATAGGSAAIADSGYAWSFGDGATGTGQLVYHTYSSPGSYTVTLTVSAGGQSVSARTSAVIVGAVAGSGGTPGFSQPTAAAAAGPGTNAVASLSSSFSDGTYAVGTDVAPGSYRALGGASCSWFRLSVAGGGRVGVTAQGSGAGPVVTIAAGDAEFQTSGCGTWTPVTLVGP